MNKAAALLCLLLSLAPLPLAAQDTPLSTRAFGARGDGKSDDTRALQAWLAAVAKSGDGYCPAGIYRTSARLEQPMHSTIRGPRGCVIQPTAALRGVTWQQGSDSVLEGISLDGSQTRGGVIGLAFDLRPAPINAGIYGVTRNVSIRNFRGEGSVGVDAGSTVHWSLQNLDMDSNQDGLHIGEKIGSKGMVGTNTLNCDKCALRGNRRWGIFGLTGGQEIYLNHPEIVNNGAAGIHLDTYGKVPHLSHVIVVGGHIELNGKPGDFQVSVRGVDNFVLRDTKFEPEMRDQCARAPRALRITDGKDFLLDNIHVCLGGNAVQIVGVAGGRIVNWPATLNGPLGANLQNQSRGPVAIAP